MKTQITFLQKFIRDDVCSHKIVFLPITPAFMMINFFSPIFFIAWFILLSLFLTLWLIVPCNPNLNCTPTTKKKDGTKALLVSFLIVYLVLFAIAVSAKIFICSDSKPKESNDYGGVLTNISSLFKKLPPKEQKRI